MTSITEKQLTTIEHIEKNLSVKFNGKGKMEAREFISKYIEKSKKAREDKKNEAIRYIFELSEERFKNDPEKLAKIVEYKNLFN